MLQATCSRSKDISANEQQLPLHQRESIVHAMLSLNSKFLAIVSFAVPVIPDTQ